MAPSPPMALEGTWANGGVRDTSGLWDSRSELREFPTVPIGAMEGLDLKQPLMKTGTGLQPVKTEPQHRWSECHACW